MIGNINKKKGTHGKQWSVSVLCVSVWYLLTTIYFKCCWTLQFNKSKYMLVGSLFILAIHYHLTTFLLQSCLRSYFNLLINGMSRYNTDNWHDDPSVYRAWRVSRSTPYALKTLCCRFRYIIGVLQQLQETFVPLPFSFL